MRDEDLKIETGYPTKPGGQGVHMPNMNVRITHTPTGLTASCATERSQMRNRNVAKAMIEYGLAEIGWQDPPPDTPPSKPPTI